MILSHKGLVKARIWFWIFIGFGIFSLNTGLLLWIFDGFDTSFFLYTACIFPFAHLFFGLIRYEEGKAKILSLWTKKMFRELDPQAVIDDFKRRQESPETVIFRPDFALYQSLILAYFVSGQTDEAFRTVEQMLSELPKKKENSILIQKASLLYGEYRVEEAEELYSRLVKEKLGAMDSLVFRELSDTDRALAIGDYVTAEAACKKKLSAKRKLQPLTELLCQANLAELYLKSGRPAEAEPYLRYTEENCGKTALWERLQSIRENTKADET